MDANKRTTLADIGFQVRQGCWSCTHSGFPTNANHSWSTCQKHTYCSFEPTETPTQHLGVHTAGTCEDHEPNEDKLAAMGSFRELLQPVREELTPGELAILVTTYEFTTRRMTHWPQAILVSLAHKLKRMMKSYP